MRGVLWSCLVLLLALAPMAARAEGRLVDFEVASKRFDGAKVGVSPVRKVTAYLPEGYETGARRYPVVYFLPNLFDGHRAIFDRDGAKAVLDRAIAQGTVAPLILVSADFSTPTGSSFYATSPVTGDWTGFLTKDLVAAVDGRLRTLPRPEARGLLGDRMGGYGAIRTAMVAPGVFGSVYALHPVGTGVGLQTMNSRPNFERLAGARSLDDLGDDGFSRVFLGMYQAFLPNPDKPPLYADLPAGGRGETLATDPVLTAKLQNAFLLDRLLPVHATELKSLRGLMFDWGRFDGNADHVVSNRAFAGLLEEFGVPNEAEEYRGWWGERHWTPGGRVEARVLPFFARTLAFEPG
ncbi:esterase [Caulobacter vibrioides]|nr:esterase [Caulobacter vibrioides]